MHHNKRESKNTKWILKLISQKESDNTKYINENVYKKELRKKKNEKKTQTTSQQNYTLRISTLKPSLNNKASISNIPKRIFRETLILYLTVGFTLFLLRHEKI